MKSKFIILLIFALAYFKINAQFLNQSFFYVPIQYTKSPQATVFSIGSHFNFIKLNKRTGNSKIVHFNFTAGPSSMPYQNDVNYNTVKDIINEEMRGTVLVDYEFDEKASSMSGNISLGYGFGIKEISLTVGPSLFFFPNHKLNITIDSHDFEWKYGDVTEFKYIVRHFRYGLEANMTILRGGFILKYGYYFPKESINFEPMHQFGICFGQRVGIRKRR